MNQTSTYQVPVLTLRSLLQLVPRPVSLLKVDAQGLDLSVTLSGEAELRGKVLKVIMEMQDVPAGEDRLIYEGQPTKSERVQPMGTVGYDLRDCTPNNPIIKEENCACVIRY